MNRLMLVSALTLFGCGKEGDTGSSGDGTTLDATGDGDEECDSSAPVVTNLNCENDGSLANLEGVGEVPVLTFTMDVDDDDGDLHRYQLELYYDETVDGEVLDAGSPYTPTTSTVDGAEECETFTLGLSFRAPIPGVPAPSTRYEWGLIVRDANTTPSERMTIACTTPAEDGSGDPDPE